MTPQRAIEGHKKTRVIQGQEAIQGQYYKIPDILGKPLANIKTIGRLLAGTVAQCGRIGYTGSTGRTGP